jgi:hypothetical protein
MVVTDDYRQALANPGRSSGLISFSPDGFPLENAR